MKKTNQCLCTVFEMSRQTFGLHFRSFFKMKGTISSVNPITGLTELRIPLISREAENNVALVQKLLLQ